MHVREDRWFAWQQRAQLWMTNVTMQGDGNHNDDCDVCGMRSSEAMIYAEGPHTSYPSIFYRVVSYPGRSLKDSSPKKETQCDVECTSITTRFPNNRLNSKTHIHDCSKVR